MQSQNTSFQIIRNESLKMAIDCYGHASIFEQRMFKYRRRIKLLEVLGILVPSIFGITVISFYKFSGFVQALILILAIFQIIQFGMSILAMIYSWDDELSYSFEASHSYSELSARFKKNAQIPSNEFSEITQHYDILSNEYRLRQQQDAKHDISEKERRKGMRSALRQFQTACVGCGTIPLSMESTECHVCGNY